MSAADNKKKIGLIGYGTQMRNFLLPSLYQIYEDVAFALHTRSILDNPIVRIGITENSLYATLEELLESKELSHIVAATNAESHQKVAKASIPKGLRCFVEKPVCTDLNELSNIAELETHYSNPLTVGMNFRCAEPLSKILKIIEYSDTSRQIDITIRFRADLSADKIALYSSQFDCFLFEFAIHPIDLACSIFRTHRMQHAKVLRSKLRDCIYLQLTNDSGNRCAFLEIERSKGPFQSKIAISSEEGVRIELEDLLDITVFDPNSRYFSDTIFGGKGSLRYRWPTRKNSLARNGYEGVMDAFITGSTDFSAKSLVPTYVILDELKTRNV